MTTRTTRIDVIPVQEVKCKVGFKVLVNFIQHGVVYHNSELANTQAKKLLNDYPLAVLHLIVIQKEEQP